MKKMDGILTSLGQMMNRFTNGLSERTGSEIRLTNSKTQPKTREGCCAKKSKLLKGAPVAHGWNRLHLGLLRDQVLRNNELQCGRLHYSVSLLGSLPAFHQPVTHRTQSDIPRVFPNDRIANSSSREVLVGGCVQNAVPCRNL